MQFIANRLIAPVLAASVVLCALISSPSVAKAGKPSGGPKSPAPPLTYTVEIIRMPSVSNGPPAPRKVNNVGEVVGNYYVKDSPQRTYYYDTLSGDGTAVNLDSITLDPEFSAPSGWFFYSAWDINNHGDIVGALGNSEDPDARRGYVLELRPDGGGLPRLHLVPDDDYGRTYPTQINDDGTVLGRADSLLAYTYKAPVHGAVGGASLDLLPFELNVLSTNAFLNNPQGTRPAQVLSNDGVLYTLGDTAPVNLGLDGYAESFTDSGLISGWHTIPGKGKQTTNVGYIYDDGEYRDVPGMFSAWDINEHADVIGNASQTYGPKLFHSELGLIDLLQAVVFTSDADKSLWDAGQPRVFEMSERGILGTDPSLASLPSILGTIDKYDLGTTPDYLFFLRPTTLLAPTSSAVPEPGTLLLAFAAFLSLMGMQRRWKRNG